MSWQLQSLPVRHHDFPTQEDKEHVLAVLVEAERALERLHRRYPMPSSGYEELHRIVGALRIVTEELARFVANDRSRIGWLGTLLSNLRYGRHELVRVERIEEADL